LAHVNLAAALVVTGSVVEAIDHYEQALRLKPQDTAIRWKLADALVATGRTKEGIGHYDQILQLMPGSPEILNSMAWLLATNEPGQGGDPARAVQLAEAARELAGPENPAMLDTLAAAYAAASRFPEAVATAAKAAELAESSGQAALAARIRARLQLYRANQPYRAAPNASGNSQGD
jgi:tetratricopeptide (TPR) repeat protein